MDNYNSLQEEKEPDDLMKENIIRKNKKKIAQGSDLPGKSMLKKSDLSLVFIGAGIITLIIFFVFLRPSDEAKTDIDKEITANAAPPVEETVKVLEQKLTTLEEMMQAINASQAATEGEPSAQMQDIKPYVARIERVETALSVKFDVLTARVDKLDDKLSAIIRDVEKNNRIVNNIKQTPHSQPQPSKHTETAVDKQVAPKKEQSETKAPAKVSSKTPEKSNVTVNKTAASTKPETASPAKQKQKQPESKSTATAYHTVAKGDTLYNISKRYDTTVEQLRAMNKMTVQDAIVIGQKLIVKK
ncbi:MAG: LysM peptidoglycan-binding domain-containing protein [Desulfamplus sp.]|nr:LysM peptidoglycan-binding domain-containing protein [Desulfamplus sp.]MBF0412343.1 LysM peptidoglycan-binding domain-containing protein [Desulfamplus sp.]